jgi:hypothetical protein
MGNFVKRLGAFPGQGAPSMSHTIQNVSLGEGFRFGFWGGDGIKIGPNNPGIASITEGKADGDANIRWFELVGSQAGNVMVEARNPADNAVWDYFQLAVGPKKPKRALMRGIRYDVSLDTTGIGPNWNASLILTINVALVPINGTGSPPQAKDFNGTAFLTKPWSNKAWFAWVSKYKAIVEKAWTEKFWLKTPTTLTDLNVTDKKTSDTYRCNMHCVLRVNVTAPAALCHHRISSVRAVRTVATPAVLVTDTTTFRSDDAHYDEKDLQTDSGLFPGLATKPFNTSVHEVGHLLGFGHPFEGTAACPTGAETACYCIAGNPDCNTIMGMGDELRLSYAAPWQRAAALWFNSDGTGRATKFTESDFVPSLTRLAPVKV